MDEIIKKLESLQNEFASVEHNARYKHSDRDIQTLGDRMTAERFAHRLGQIILDIKHKEESDNTIPFILPEVGPDACA